MPNILHNAKRPTLGLLLVLLCALPARANEFDTAYLQGLRSRHLYTLATTYAFPSLVEGFGLPVLEAFACGTPVLTSNVTAMAEVAGEAAITIDPLSHTEMADGLRRLLTDEALRTDLSAKGLARAADFTWERTARQTLAAYEKALG